VRKIISVKAAFASIALQIDPVQTPEGRIGKPGDQRHIVSRKIEAGKIILNVTNTVGKSF